MPVAAAYALESADAGSPEAMDDAVEVAEVTVDVTA